MKSNERPAPVRPKLEDVFPVNVVKAPSRVCRVGVDPDCCYYCRDARQCYLESCGEAGS
jgi:hypothetical protein